MLLSQAERRGEGERNKKKTGRGLRYCDTWQKKAWTFGFKRKTLLGCESQGIFVLKLKEGGF